MNDILSEVKKPLTERGWECVPRTTHSGHRIYEFRNHPQNELESETSARQCQALIDQPLLIARIEELEAERRWIPVETIPATRNKGDYVKNCSEWFLLLFDDGEVCKGWYQDGVWYRREAHTNLAMPCDPTDYQAFPQEVKA